LVKLDQLDAGTRTDIRPDENLAQLAETTASLRDSSSFLERTAEHGERVVYPGRQGYASLPLAAVYRST